MKLSRPRASAVWLAMKLVAPFEHGQAALEPNKTSGWHTTDWSRADPRFGPQNGIPQQSQH